ncbi:MAG: hypothetical protein HY000_07120 [Planctomycetes bacterium]|nr:hypothetical protein [Planctomycetota bacterium]
MRVSELKGYRDGDYEIHDVFCFRQTGVDSTGAAQGSFWATGYQPSCLARLKTAGFELDPSLFEERELKAGANGTAPRKNW